MASTIGRVATLLVGVWMLCNPSFAQETAELRRQGGERANINFPPFLHPTYANVTSFRQDLCPRYEQYRMGKVALRDALRGLEIRAVLHWDQFFQYSYEDGINSDFPGVQAQLLDLVAERAGFTWRNSFAYHGNAAEYNITWTELLWWAANTYDVAINNWDHSLSRMELGVTFVEPWYDGSIILVERPLRMKGEDSNWEVEVLWNWLRPFDASVWYLIAFTIFISGVVYQLIEHMEGEKGDRTMGQWFMDNLYLSMLNFTTNFEYAPSSPSGRIFAVSMGIWALVISATYTANLASLFVEQNQGSITVSSIEEAAAKKLPICTYKDTNSDALIKQRYHTVKRRPMDSNLGMYHAIQAGECRLLVDSRSSWDSFKGYKEYNPYCNLESVGETVAEVNSGFAMKGDVGHKCTSLIRDVFNLYMRELIDDGELDIAWQRQRAILQDIDCDDPGAVGNLNENVEDQDGLRKRLLRSSNPLQQDKRQRALKASSKSPAQTQSTPESQSLTLQHMIGTFALHYGMMLMAILVSVVSAFWTRQKDTFELPRPRNVFSRPHGPIIGSPPPMGVSSPCLSENQTQRRMSSLAIGTTRKIGTNTFVIRTNSGADMVRTNSGMDPTMNESEESLERRGVGPRPYPGSSRKQMLESNTNDLSASPFKEYFDAELQRVAQDIEKRVEKKFEEKLEAQTRLLARMMRDIVSQDTAPTENGPLDEQSVGKSVIDKEGWASSAANVT